MAIEPQPWIAGRRAVTESELAAPLLAYDDAVSLVRSALLPLFPANVAIGDSAGLVIAQEILVTQDVPGYANSAMDGYAVRAADTSSATKVSPVVLRIVDESADPDDQDFLGGTAIKIMTGAMIPNGADSVVPWEHAERSDGEIALSAPVTPGHHVRAQGEDLAKGDLVGRLGDVVHPTLIGVLASIGRSTIKARPRPRVALVITGSELVPAGEPLRPRTIHDANGPLLAALCEAAGAVVVSQELIGDDREAIADALERAASTADLIVTSGGASVGERDWLRDVVAEHGELAMWRVAMKPGKPVAFGGIAKKPVLVLPGNPGSAFTCAHVFVVPAIRALLGVDPAPESCDAVLDADVEGSPKRTALVPVIIDGGQAHVLPMRSSVVLSTYISANALAIVPAGGASKGDAIRVELVRWART